MTKSKGRPPKAIKQEKSITIRVTNKQYAIIRQEAAQAKVNVAEYIRQVVDNGYVKIRWTEEDVDLIKQLVVLSNDLHQVAGIAEREGVMSAMLFFGKYRDKIDEVIKQLKNDQ
jgi:hypothetical protein